MPRRKWKLRIHHILDAIGKIRAYTAGMSPEAFSTNDLVVDAVLRNFMVIGAATRHIPPHVTTAYPQIPWRLMQDMRNVVIHNYSNVILQVVWETIQNDLPLLLEPLRNLLEALKNELGLGLSHATS
jgi:uncharacterized protein with HEPN domain